MKFLLDENISWRIIKLIKAVFHDAIHVNRIEVQQPARDTDIWKWAKTHEAIIVTKDDDFVSLSMEYGFPPKVILIKSGNQTKEYISQFLLANKK
ncbi:MAG: putative nuclease of putative toxin-antitoxin system [Flammeovirgaceae bacterium]|jgi:predicted nuclease of predicted toxin-antitoxin system